MRGGVRVAVLVAVVFIASTVFPTLRDMFAPLFRPFKRFDSKIDTMPKQQNGHLNGFGEKQPPTSPHLEIRTLPDDASVIARKYADYLELPDLVVPLSQFLTHAIEVSGLDGIGVALWTMPARTPMLAIYALSDLSILDLPDAPSPDAVVAALYAELDSTVSAFVGQPVQSSLWSMNSVGGTYEQLVEVYPTKLKDLFLGDLDRGKLALPADLAVFPRGVLARAA